MRKTILTSTCLFLIAGLSTLFAQTTINQFLASQSSSFQKTNYGVYYHIEKEGTGQVAQKGDYVMLRYTGKLLDGKVFDQSDSGEPFVFEVGYQQVIRGLDVGMTLFKKGSKGQLVIPAELAYGRSGVGKTVPPNAALVFDIEMQDILDAKAYNNYMRDLEQKERLAFENGIKEQYSNDLKQIQEYALDHKLRTKRTPNDVSYTITKQGKGNVAQAGDQLKVSYKGFLMDGTSFDASKKNAPFEFELGAGKVIEGWEDGLQFFNEGAEGWLLIPSKLAYGPRSIEEGAISIPSNSVLIFQIKVEDIVRKEFIETRR